MERGELNHLVFNVSDGVLHLDASSDPEDGNSPSIRDVLESKQPPRQPASIDCIIPSDTQDTPSNL